ncbi:MAG: rhodanese-like domain-containing protein [Thiotrichales bacterium]
MYGIETIDAATLAAWLETGKRVRLIDVRSPAEVARGALPNAEAIPLHLVPVFPPHPRSGEVLVFYCQSGARSAQACMYMSQHGVAEPHNLAGGIIGWMRQGLPIVAPDERLMAG